MTFLLPMSVFFNLCSYFGKGLSLDIGFCDGGKVSDPCLQYIKYKVNVSIDMDLTR